MCVCVCVCVCVGKVIASGLDYDPSHISANLFPLDETRMFANMALNGGTLQLLQVDH